MNGEQCRAAARLNRGARLHNLGLSLLAIGEEEEAAGALERALTLAPGLESARRLLGSMRGADGR